MAKSAKTKSSRTPMDPEKVRKIRRIIALGLLGLVLVSGIAIAFHSLDRWVAAKVTFPAYPPRIVLKNRPAWMSDTLAGQISASVRPSTPSSVYDQRALRNAYDQLATNSWVRQVKQVRRVFGQQPGDTIEVDCEFRAPVALVHWKDYFWLIDSEGVKLPEQYAPHELRKVVMSANSTTALRVIEGVRQAPPETGRKWVGPDLMAGIDLARLLYGQSFADEIVAIDVNNFEGRRDPREAQIILHTKNNTQVRWGRPVNSKDFFIEVSTPRKLAALQRVYTQYKHVDANQPWIDIRFDKITYPNPDPATAQNDSR